MGTKHQSSDATSDPKKRRRVGFTKIDAGVEPNECIEIYLVSSKEEVGATDSFPIEPVDLNHFFGDDGKIYGYQGLKITIWVSSVSFHSYADIAFESTSDGGKGITDLKSSLQNIFAETLVESKDDFLQTLSSESGYIESIVSQGEILQQKASNGEGGDSNSNIQEEASNVEVVKIVGSENVGPLYCRLVPLVLILVDGSNPIDIDDSGWEIYLSVQKKIDQQGESRSRLLGFAAVYRFHHYPDSSRLRLGQILILPSYHHKGYGRSLLEVLYNIAISENVYDLTVEEPSDSLQHVRTCIDVLRLNDFDPLQEALGSVIVRLKQENLSKKSQSCHFGPPPSVVEDVRRFLKINKKQFRRCWEVLIYIGLDSNKYMENFRILVSDRIRADVIGKDSGTAGKRLMEVPTEYEQEMSFVMFKSRDGGASAVEMDENQTNQEEHLWQLVDERLKDVKLIAQKVSMY